MVPTPTAGNYMAYYGRGYGGGGSGRLYTYRYIVTTTASQCLKVGSDAESHFNVSVGSDGQSHKTVSTKTQPF